MKQFIINYQPHIYSEYCYDDACKIARSRALGKCEVCGILEKPIRKLIVHHKTELSTESRFLCLFNHPSNLQVVCRRCHSRLHAQG
jgi:hypothetical protein